MAVICISYFQLPVLFEPWFQCYQHYFSPSSISIRWAECCWYSRDLRNRISLYFVRVWMLLLPHGLLSLASRISEYLKPDCLLAAAFPFWTVDIWSGCPMFLRHVRIGKDPNCFFSDHIWEVKSNSTLLEQTGSCQKVENLIRSLWKVFFSSFNVKNAIEMSGYTEHMLGSWLISCDYSQN